MSLLGQAEINVRAGTGGRRKVASAVFVVVVMLATMFASVPSAQAAVTLTFANTDFAPGLGWDIVGLDSNDVTAGPNEFAQGAKVCNDPGSTGPATNVIVRWFFDGTPTPSPYINLQPGSPSSNNLGTLAVGACADAYFNIEITRNTAAYDTFSRYHMTVEADGVAAISTQNCYAGPGTPGACGTGPYQGYRQLYVEHLVSQNRNSVTFIKFMDKTVADAGGGPNDSCTAGTAGSGTVYVGRTYYFCLSSSTATNGYNQLTTYLNLPNTIFQVQTVQATYTAPPAYTGDQIYEDACQQVKNPYHTFYRVNNKDCLGTGKVGGDVIMIFTVKIIARGGPIAVTALIYDGSGSSYHYNGPSYGIAPNLLTITDVGWQWAKAQDGPNGTDVSWRTAYEADNLGFNLYRVSQSGRVKLNDSIVAGSALSTGPEALLAGKTYHWMVPLANAPPGSDYWIQAMDLKGDSQWYGPIKATESGASVAAKASSPLLSAVGSGTASSSATPLVSRSVARAPISSKAAAFTQARAVKVGVDHEGWYSVPLSQLSTMGVDVSDPSRLQVFADGVEQAAQVRDGAVQFYGLGIDTPWTATRAYWIAKGWAGRRIRTVRPDGGRPGAAWFPATAVKRDRSVYFSSLLNGSASNFFGVPVTQTVSTQSVVVENLAQSDPASLTVSLQGVTKGDHDVSVSFNGQAVGHLTWSGQSIAQATFAAPGLHGGSNPVALASSGGSDISLTSQIRLAYPRTLMADQGPLRFTARGGTKVTVGGFDTRGARLYDVTDPAHPSQPRTVERPDGHGGYTASVVVPGEGERVMYAFDPSQVSTPTEVTRGSNALLSSRRGSDMVIVSAPQLIPSLDPLVAMHQDQGLSVSVVDANGIYDRYGSGEKSPQAIRDFLSDALSRDTAPRYVLLVGDASLDPRGFMGPAGAAADLVPTMMVDTSLMETPSDVWYANRDGNGPAFALGRLPVRTPQETETLVSKIVNYENAPDSTSFVVATDAADIDFDFAAEIPNVSALVPSGTDVVTVDRGSAADPRADLFAAMADEPAVLDYMGHGSVDLWRGGFLTGADAQSLANVDHPAFLVSMTCLNGYFVDPNLDSLSESLLKAPGGVVGAWASSGMTDAGPQTQLNRAFLAALYSDAAPYVGDAVVQAERSVTSMDVLLTWTLLGDPAVRVH